MRCPFCRAEETRVVDSRDADDQQAVRRRRLCQTCDRRFTTVETAALSVVKRSGARESFSRSKVAVGVRKACQGRPVLADDIDLLAHRVEEEVRSGGRAEVAAIDVGRAILEPLRALDEVAYLRFASVYRAFDSLEDFEAEIRSLRTARPGQEGRQSPASGDAVAPETAEAPGLLVPRQRSAG